MRLTDKKKNILKERVFIYSIIAIPLISFVIFYIGINGGSTENHSTQLTPQ